ncbi:MAG: SCO family protein [Caldilineaceae bacterium]
MNRRIILAISLLVLLLGIGGGAAYAWLRPYQSHGFMLDKATPATDFTLNAAGNQRVSLSDYRGKIVLLYFGYTHCPDVCPTTMADLRVALSELETKANDIQVIMVSVDPERDSPQWLADYVHRFDDRFLGLTGPLDQVTEIATAYGIRFQKHAGTAATGYLIDHTAKVTVIDRQGNTRMFFPFGLTSEEMAEDLRYMLSL